jgi:hypothetical protein
MKSILGESMTPAARSNGDPRFELANQAACTDWETWVIWECTDRPYHVTSTRPGDRRVKAVAGARVTTGLSRAICSTGAGAIVGAEIPQCWMGGPWANTVGTGLARSPPTPLDRGVPSHALVERAWSCTPRLFGSRTQERVRVDVAR